MYQRLVSALLSIKNLSGLVTRGSTGLTVYKPNKINAANLKLYRDREYTVIAASYPVHEVQTNDYHMWHRGRSGLEEYEFKKYVKNELKYPYTRYIHRLQKIYKYMPLYRMEKIDIHMDRVGSKMVLDQELEFKAKNILDYD